METDRHIWRTWARLLQQWGISEWAITLLENLGPFDLIGAQLVYMSQPFLGGTMKLHLEEFGRILEDQDCRQSFVEFLREAPA